MMRRGRKRLGALLILVAVIIVGGMGLRGYRQAQELNRRLMALEIGVMQQESRLASLRDDLSNLAEVTCAAFAAIQAELERWEIIELTATAYAPFENISGICADENPWSTATGTVPGPGTIAVNPAMIPYGTRMYVEGYGWGVASDTGRLIRQRSDLIDLFMWTHSEAIAWGRKTVKVLLEVGR